MKDDYLRSLLKFLGVQLTGVVWKGDISHRY